jgi:hypothetical protein
MEMPVVLKSKTGRSLSLKMLARYAITTEQLAFWHAMAVGYASKPVMINIEIAPGKTVVVAESKLSGLTLGSAVAETQRMLALRRIAEGVPEVSSPLRPRRFARDRGCARAVHIGNDDPRRRWHWLHDPDVKTSIVGCV